MKVNNIPWDLILRYLEKQATPDEELLLEAWLGVDDHYEVFLEIKTIYNLTSKYPASRKPDKDQLWEKINSRIESPRQPLFSFKKPFKYAAAAIILFLLGFSFSWLLNSTHHEEKKQYSEIIAPSGQKTMVILPDSFSVWLNSGSSLRYSDNYNNQEREVILRGEAFFNVKSDKNRVFKVQSGMLLVQVYGTSFNVKNYEEDNFQEVTVNEGRIDVLENALELGQLLPGEQALFNKSSRNIAFSTVDPSIISSWKEEELVFNQTPLNKLIKYMERWYGVTIEIKNLEAIKHNYTFTIKDESVAEILEKIKWITPIKYTINDKNIIIEYMN